MRGFRVEDAPASRGSSARLWRLANGCTPATRVAHYTQAIMDLRRHGLHARETRLRPLPVANGCAALAAGRTDALPVAKRRAPRRERSAHFVFVVAGRRVLLNVARRGHLGRTVGAAGVSECGGGCNLHGGALRRGRAGRGGCRRVRHAFTHFDLDIEPWVLELGADGW